MTDYATQSGDRFALLQVRDPNEVVRPLTRVVPTPTGDVIEAFTGEGVFFEVGAPLTVPSTDYKTELLDGLGEFWFEIIHVVPRTISLGNILTTITTTITIYNADRFQSHDFLTFTNDAGAGITIPDLPALTYELPSQTGIQLTLTVSTDGPPTINGVLEFLFDLYQIDVPVTGQRIVVFPFQPEAPVTEFLDFLTEVMIHKDRTEQRISLRKNPRQEFNLRFLRDEGTPLTRMDSLLFEWQSRVFGLPIWTETNFLTSAAASSDTTINVDSTDNADFRVGGFAVIMGSETEFEALEIESFTSTSITFASPLQFSYAADVLVMPMRTAITSANITGNRYKVNLAERQIQFRVLDNDVGAAFADATPYTVDDSNSVFDDEILLSGYNLIRGNLQESFQQRVVELDNETGKFGQVSSDPYNLRSAPFSFLTKSPAQLMRVRKLLHALKGRQVSFFVPTFYRDLEVVQTIANGSATITINHIGYSRFVEERGRYTYLRIQLTDGTSYDAQVTDSGELSATQEQLTLSRTAPREILASEVQRIDFVERVRIDADRITIQHVDGGGQAIIGFPTLSVDE